MYGSKTFSENHFSLPLNRCSHSPHSSGYFRPSCIRRLGLPLTRKCFEPVSFIQSKTNFGMMWLSRSSLVWPHNRHTPVAIIHLGVTELVALRSRHVGLRRLRRHHARDPGVVSL